VVTTIRAEARRRHCGGIFDADLSRFEENHEKQGQKVERKVPDHRIYRERERGERPVPIRKEEKRGQLFTLAVCPFCLRN